MIFSETYVRNVALLLFLKPDKTSKVDAPLTVFASYVIAPIGFAFNLNSNILMTHESSTLFASNTKKLQEHRICP